MPDIRTFLQYKILTLIILFFGASYSISAEKSGDYRVGADDVIDISIYDQPDLSKTVRVLPDGSISFPLLGSLKVDGLTVSELESHLEESLSKDYLVNPQVSVFIREFRSRKIYLLGEVVRPGLLELTGPTTLLEALSRVGGVKKEAGKTAIISRRGKGEKKGGENTDPIKIDMVKLLEEGDTSLNIALQEGDVVHVPKANSFFIMGEVKKPGSYILDKGITIVQAITMAGGFTKIAAPTRTKIIRIKDGKEETITVVVTDVTKRGDKSKDIDLEPDDIIVIPESFF